MSGSPGAAGTLVVPVYHDFASSLCYVAHRVMAGLDAELRALCVELDWRPIDLAALRGLRRGAAIRPADRARVAAVAGDLGVALRMPAVWLDSRAALAAAAAADPPARAAALRERLYSAIYEEGRLPETAEAVARLAREVGGPPPAEALARGPRAVAIHTEAARRAQVTGIPSFQLGAWPFGGIQRRDTMLHVLERFARKAREGALLAP